MEQAMKLVIEINDEDYIKSFLAIISVGAIESIKEKKISIHQSENLLFGPRMIFMLKENFPDLSDIVHEGTEMENIDRLYPEKIDQYIDEIKLKSLEQIRFKDFGEYINYSFEELQKKNN